MNKQSLPVILTIILSYFEANTQISVHEALNFVQGYFNEENYRYLLFADCDAMIASTSQINLGDTASTAINNGTILLELKETASLSIRRK